MWGLTVIPWPGRWLFAAQRSGSTRAFPVIQSVPARGPKPAQPVEDGTQGKVEDAERIVNRFRSRHDRPDHVTPLLVTHAHFSHAHFIQYAWAFAVSDGELQACLPFALGAFIFNQKTRPLEQKHDKPIAHLGASSSAIKHS